MQQGLLLQLQPRDPRHAVQDRSLPALAGEQEDLPLLRQLPQQLQGQRQPLVVEGGQGVVQQDGGLFGQAQLTDVRLTAEYRSPVSRAR